MNRADVTSVAGRWPIRPLVDVVERIFVGVPVSRYAAKPGTPSITIPILSVGDIENGHLSAVEHVSKVDLRMENFERFLVRPGDVLLACRGTVLKAAPVLGDMGCVLASSNIITIRPDRSVVAPQILIALLRSLPWQDTLRSRTRSSTGLMQLTVKDIEHLPVPVPDETFQGKLAELVDAEDRAYRSALKAANARHTLVESLVAQALLEPIRENR